MQDFLLTLQATRHPRTVDTASVCLRPFLNYCEHHAIHTPDAFTRTHWLEFLHQTRQLDASAWTIRNYARIARQFLNWCEREGVLENNPSRTQDLPRKPEPNPQPLSLVQVRRLLDALNGSHWLEKRNYALALTLLDVGLRRSEALQMTVADAYSGVIRVQAKGGRFHTVFLAPETQLAIRRYLRAFTRHTGTALGEYEPLWRARNGQPLEASGLRRVFSKVSTALGERVYPHRLRSTCATLRLAVSGSPEMVRECLGHIDRSSLEHYARLASEDKARILRETSPVNLLHNRKPREQRR
ncbi:MAG: tyrosine-type recombinase/integrase [bacterium]|nr:tyrosine-type recombinase/integrase [bacterium]